MNLGNLKSIESKKFTRKKIIVDNYEVMVDEVFRESKISEMVKECLEKVNYTKELGIEMNTTDYAIILLIKYFTDISVSDKFEEQIETLKILLDLGYLNTIVEAFDEKEIDKAVKKIYEYTDKLTKLVEDMQKEKEDEEAEEVDSIKVTHEDGTTTLTTSEGFNRMEVVE